MEKALTNLLEKIREKINKRIQRLEE